MHIVFDLDKISPPPAARDQSQEERRLRLAIDKAQKSRNPQHAVTQLVTYAHNQTLHSISQNTRMRLLVGLRPANEEDPVSEDVLKARIKLYASLDMGTRFKDQGRDLGQRISRRFIAALKGEDLEKSWSGLDEDGRLDVVIGFLHAYGHESGFLPPSRVETKEMRPTANGRIRASYYVPNDDDLVLNSHPSAGWESAVEVLSSTGHETIHKMQADMSRLLMAEQRPDLLGTEPTDKALFADDDERLMAWYFFDNFRYGYIAPADNQIGYKHQPVEAHAYLVEAAIKQSLNRHLVLGADQSLITGVSHDDLTALGIDPDKLRTDSPANDKGSPGRRDQHLPRHGM
ncbi:MAG: hypothetical protein AAF213_02925 [Pseudomonadota bacterium]